MEETYYGELVICWKSQKGKQGKWDIPMVYDHRTPLLPIALKDNERGMYGQSPKELCGQAIRREPESQKRWSSRGQSQLLGL